MALGESQMRAALSQTLVGMVGRLSAAESDAIFARAGADAMDAIMAPLAVAWVPSSHHMCLSVAIRAVLGPKRNIELWCRTMEDTFQKPFLRSFVSVTTSLLGLRPVSLFKHGGRIYEHVTRNMGAMSYDAMGETRGEVTLTGFPTKAFDFECYAEGLAGSVEAIFAICKTTGIVEVMGTDTKRGDVRYRVSWS